jgi:hypothetical protein
MLLLQTRTESSSSSRMMQIWVMALLLLQMTSSSRSQQQQQQVVRGSAQLPAAEPLLTLGALPHPWSKIHPQLLQQQQGALLLQALM